MNQAAAIDAVLRTLADATRRAVFERIVGAEEITVAELTRGSGVTQGAISQHLKSLREAGLVAVRPEGRNVFYRAEPKGLAPLVDWMGHYGVFWRERFDSLRNLLKEIDPVKDAAVKSSISDSATQAIVVDEIFPHAPEILWKTLTTGALIGRWMMQPDGFEPVVGNHFTFKTKPAGAWDGTIHCEVLEAVPNERFAYAWKAGDAGNLGYGSRLDTVVTFLLSQAENGTRLRLIHSGFALPQNESAYQSLGTGWKTCFQRIGALIDSED